MREFRRKRARVGTVLRCRSIALLAALLGFLVVAPSASARVVFSRAWGWGVRDGAHQLETCTAACRAGIAGPGAGQLSDPLDVAVAASGEAYVVDDGNNRIDEFSTGGAFTRAWGWGVLDGMSSFETCTTSCQAGMMGGGAGQFNNVLSITADPSGELYVADGNNQRIQEFSATGGFVKTWGWGVTNGMSEPELCMMTCQSGIRGAGAGQFQEPASIAADHSGNVYVSDLQNYRVEAFSEGSTFERAWGWGVADGASQFETCTSVCQAGVMGAGAGQFFNADGIAVDPSGHVYVTNTPNERLDEFSAEGTFIRGLGWGVKDGAHRFETCTTSCRRGIGGGGVGEFHFPEDVVTDSSGHVYVADTGNERIDEFSPGGRFMKAWGWGVKDGAHRFETCTTTCQGGLQGAGAGQLDVPTGLSTDASGSIYVADEDNERIDEFTVIPPQTTITSGPANGSKTTDRTPTFGFKSSETGSSFQCQLDAGAFKPCTSPHTTATLSIGSHTFEVRAIDKAKDVDPSPASRTFQVIR